MTLARRIGRRAQTRRFLAAFRVAVFFRDEFLAAEAEGAPGALKAFGTYLCAFQSYSK